jgi:formate dehydrogenase beta subunit
MMVVTRKPTGMPPCQEACPVHLDVPRYVRHIAQEDFDQALAVIREKIPFPWVCGIICARPCEGRCNMKFLDGPIAIRALKRAAAEKGKPIEVGPPSFSTGNKVAVIGSGASGLTAAFYLAGLASAFRSERK